MSGLGTYRVEQPTASAHVPPCHPSRRRSLHPTDSGRAGVSAGTGLHAAKPSFVVIAPWTDYKKAGPLLFSLDHQSKADDTPVHIFFSNVAVKVTGSENWINTQ